MSIALTLFQQVLMMFLLAAIGFLLFRSGKISAEGSRAIGNILIYVSLPCVIINSFLTDYSAERLRALGISALLAAVIIGAGMALSQLCFRRDGMAVFAGAFSNPGFFGIPLITAMGSQEDVFYIVPFIAALNILQWSWGVSRLTGEKSSMTVKSILTAPMMIAIYIGLFCFLTQIPVHGILRQAVNYLAGVNTPLAMFAIGVYLAQTDLKDLLARRKLWAISAVRLLVIPLVSLLVLNFVPSSMSAMKTAILIAAACPVGSNIAVYAHLHGKDYPYAAETVVHSTILAIVTMPAVMAVAQMIWK